MSQEDKEINKRMADVFKRIKDKPEKMYLLGRAESAAEHSEKQKKS